MPIYEYQCTSCGERFDTFIRSISQTLPKIVCPTCQSEEVQRLISAPAIHTGNASTDSGAAEAADLSPEKPAVFGRKELQAAQEKKRQLRESVKHDNS
jgi:putative FmdB family regulatory protein